MGRQATRVRDGTVNAGPLSERPIDELRAVQEALEGNEFEPDEARYSVQLTDGTVTLFEIGEFGTLVDDNSKTPLTKSKIWRADLAEVEEEIIRREL